MGRRPAVKELELVAKPTTIVNKLLTVFPPKIGDKGPSSTRKGVIPRSDVVSEQLCDDVLKYLAPTLEPYKGCTIIDINPGACLWSEKLHNFLNPKSHILMEPDKAYVKPFIEPLLSRPGSKYKHTTLAGIDSVDYTQNWNKIFSEGDLLGRVKLPEDDPNLRRVDTSLLVTGSLLRRNKTTHISAKGFASAQAALGNAAWMSLHNGIFHQAGLVRMLWWIPEPDKVPFFPPIGNFRTQPSAAMGLSSHINQVVAIKDVRSYLSQQKKDAGRLRTRQGTISAASAAQVRESMTRLGMSPPEGRELHALEHIKDGDKTASASESPLAVRYETRAELEAEVNKLVTRIEKAVKLSRGRLTVSKAPAIHELVKGIRYTRVLNAIAENPARFTLQYRPEHGEGRADGTSLHELRMAVWADFHLCLINLEVHYKVFEERGIDVSEFKPRLASLSGPLEAVLGNDATRVFADAGRLWEDPMDLYRSPPTLLSDRRQYEPLQADPEDFLPATYAALLDMTPKEFDLEVPGLANRGEVTRILTYLMKFLFSFKNRGVTLVLEKIAPNAANDLIPMVPAITDPRRGGRLDPSHLKIRQMTDEMFVGLAKAWVEWPFKPEPYELADLSTMEAAISHKFWLTPEAVTDVEEEGTL